MKTGILEGNANDRRIRGDMIETYKIINGIYDREASPVLKLNLSTKTGGNLI